MLRGEASEDIDLSVVGDGPRFASALAAELNGEVTKVSPSDPMMLQTAEVRPGVDFGRLDQVFVMLRRGQTMELLYATGEGDAGDAAERGTP